MALGLLWPCHGAHGGGTGVALGGQEGCAAVGEGMGQAVGWDGTGRQQVVHPHPAESFCQGSPVQVRAQGRSQVVRLRLLGCASLGVTQGTG